MRTLCLFLILLAFLPKVCTANNASAQTKPTANAAKGSLHVSVSDQQSKLITTGKATLTNHNQTLEANINRQGIIVFKALSAGSYLLNIVSDGFTPFTTNITIKKGLHELKVKLLVQEVKETVEVQPNQREQRFNDAFNEVLTDQEILLLGNDIALELKQRYGADILFEIDGFMGGQMPPKEQIALIKIIKNSFDAEFHKIGQTVVKITTKAGYGRLNGSVYFKFNDYRLNARNPFETERLPNQDRSVFGNFSVPLVKEKASLSAQAYLGNNTQRKNIIAKAPDRKALNSLNTSFLSLNSTVALRVNVGEAQNIKLEHEHENLVNKNIGVGGLNLPERGYSNSGASHKFRFYSGGIIKNKYINDFKVAYYTTKQDEKPNSRETGITVLGLFNAGGAGIDNTSSNKKLLLGSNLMFDYQQHLFKFGFLLEHEKRKSLFLNNTNGNFTFTDKEAYLRSLPSVFSIREGKNLTTLKSQKTQTAFYVNDDIRLFKNLQVGLGLRYERQTNVRKGHNFSPRISFTYSPFQSGKLVFRGGAGIFYEWFKLEDLDYIRANDGRQARELIIDQPSFPNPSLEGKARDAQPANIHQKDENLKNPYIITANGAFNYRLSKYIKLEGTYTFNKGVRQFRSRDINAPLDFYGTRPNPDMGQVISLNSSGNLVRHEFELEANGNFRQSFFYFLTYKLASEKTDYGWKFGLPASSNNLSDEWGFSNVDQRHYFYSFFSLSPFKNKHIRFTPTFHFTSPMPYTITTGRDNNEDTVFNDRPVGVPRNSARGAWHFSFDLGLNWELPFLKITDQGTFEGKSVTFEIEIENLFNRANLKGFVGNRRSPFFGQPTFASQPRSVKLGLRFTFF